MNVFETVLSQINLMDIIQHYYTPRKIKPGKETLINPCPFCGGHKGGGKGGNDSFFVNSKKQVYRCHACEEGGDALDFVMKIRNLSNRYEAAQEINLSCGLKIDFEAFKTNGRDNGTPPAAAEPGIEIRKKIFKTAATFFHQTLLRDQKALEILKKERKFEKKFLETQPVGYSGNRRGMLLAALEANFSREELLQSGLVFANDKGEVYEYFPPQFFIYFHIVDSQVCNFSAKYALKKSLKKDDERRKESHLKAEFRLQDYAPFNFNDLSGNEVIFVEGQNDALQIKRIDEKAHVVADKNFTDEELLRRRLKHTKMIYLWFDPDQAGDNYVRRFFDKFWGDFPIKVIIPDDEDRDPDDYLKHSNDPQEKLAMVREKSVELFNYLIKKIPESEDPYTTILKLEPLTRKFSTAQNQWLIDLSVENLKKQFSNPSIGKVISENVKKDRYSKEVSGPTQENLPYFEENGVYKKQIFKGPQTISNFVLRIENIVLYNEEVRYLCSLINERGEIAEEVEFEPIQRVDRRKFSEKLAGSGRGSYYFTGTNADLSGIWQYEERRREINLTMFVRHYGEVRHLNMWIFQNCIIKNGQIYRKNKEDDYIIVDGTNFMSRGVNAYSKTKPSLNLEFECTQGFINHVARRFNQVVDCRHDGTISEYQGLLILGFLPANIYCKEIEEHLTFFPHLLAYGQAESGKSSILGLLNMAFGWPREKSHDPWDKATPAGTFQFLEQISSMPYHYDEFRNGPVFERMEGTIRSVFDRVGEGKGGKYNERQSSIVNGTMWFSGQDIPQDEAIITRSVYFRFFKLEGNQHRDEAYRWFREQKWNLSAITRKLIMGKNDQTAGEILQLIDEYAEMIQGHNSAIGDRISKCYAVPAAALRALNIDIPDDFYEFLCKHASANLVNRFRENPVYIFFSELAFLADEKFQGEPILVNDVVFQPNVGLLALRFNRTIRKIMHSLAQRRKDATFTPEAFKNALMEDKSFADNNVEVKINGTTRKCMRFNINRLADELRDELSFFSIGN